MSGLVVAAGVGLGLVFAWQVIGITDPARAARAARAVRSGAHWVSSRVSRSALAATVALPLIWTGAIAIMVGTVLPLGQAQSILTFLSHNSLLEHGGWTLIGLAVTAAAMGYRGYRAGSRSWTPFVLGLVSLGVVAWMATDFGFRTGYAALLGCCPTRVLTVFPLAVGPYVAGAGAILISIGGWLLRLTSGVTNGHSLRTLFRVRKAARPETTSKRVGQSRPV